MRYIVIDFSVKIGLGGMKTIGTVLLLVSFFIVSFQIPLTSESFTVLFVIVLGSIMGAGGAGGVTVGVTITLSVMKREY
jgi:hypothetical protein